MFSLYRKIKLLLFYSPVDDVLSTDIIAFNKEEQKLVRDIFKKLRRKSKITLIDIAKKIIDLEKISSAVSRFPAIKESSELAGEKRNSETLIDTLCSTKPDFRMFSLPAKAVLGKGYLVAKFHTFSALTKIASNFEFPEEDLIRLRAATLNIMFTIMAEDVYISLLNDGSIMENIKSQVAKSLTDLWERRLDKNTTDFAPVLTSVWEARDKIAPAFGTMLGTSELFLLSAALGKSWEQFMLAKLGDPKIGEALEEFLFGISHEEIVYVREKLVKDGICAVSRDEVAAMLYKENNFTDKSPKVFYASYSERRHNAEARRRLKAEGPKHTLEDYYIGFLFEQKQLSETNAHEHKA